MGSSFAAAPTLLVCFAAPARLELPPWVDGDNQRQSPVVVEIQLERSQARGPRQLLRARLWRFAPAAGDRSFGPSLVEVLDRLAPAASRSLASRQAPGHEGSQRPF